VQDPSITIYVILTEVQTKSPYFPLDPKVKVIELDIDFLNDRFLKDKILNYQKRIRLYRKKIAKVIDEVKPDIVTSFMSHEIDFIYRLSDSSVKIGENHFNRDFRYSFVKNNTANIFHRLIAKYRNYKLGKDVEKLDALVSLTEADSALWSDKVYKAVIPNPLSFTSEVKSDCTKHKIVAAGRLTREKGFDRILEAWSIIAKDHQDWSLNIHGEGTEEVSLQAMIDAGIPNAYIHPFEKYISDIFVDSSIFVLGSRFEGFGLVLIEAMECGLPVISFDCKSGPREIITDGRDGFLIKDSDIYAFAMAMTKLINDENLRVEMGRNAMHKANKYAITNVMEKWKILYQTLIGREYIEKG
jgi:glycosyltransferase involved in cell wall biosynthesis